MRLGCKVKKAVITVPAFFNDRQKQATRDAARIAGLDVLQLLDESKAAAMPYAMTRLEDGNTSKGYCLVFDFKGSTLDISVCTIEGRSIKTLSSDGDIHLGGADFDNEILKLCMN